MPLRLSSFPPFRLPSLPHNSSSSSLLRLAPAPLLPPTRLSRKPIQFQKYPPLRHSSSTSASASQPSPRTTAVIDPSVNPYIPAPPPGTVLTERLPNRDLPPLRPPRRYLIHIPLFLLCCAISSLAIFNYQKQSSPIVSSVLYALRRNQTARDLLGDEIYFASGWPWIRGEMNQVQGRVDLGWYVRGTKGTGYIRIVSRREGGRMGGFRTKEWSLEMETDDNNSHMDGKKRVKRRIDLLKESEGIDPFTGEVRGP